MTASGKGTPPLVRPPPAEITNAPLTVPVGAAGLGELTSFAPPSVRRPRGRKLQRPRRLGRGGLQFLLPPPPPLRLRPLPKATVCNQELCVIICLN